MHNRTEEAILAYEKECRFSDNTPIAADVTGQFLLGEIVQPLLAPPVLVLGSLPPLGMGDGLWRGREGKGRCPIMHTAYGDRGTRGEERERGR